jgi:hypothetical protein
LDIIAGILDCEGLIGEVGESLIVMLGFSFVVILYTWFKSLIKFHFLWFSLLLIRVAIHAIEVKNHTTLNGKLIRVMWSLRDPDARRSGKGNVFVKVFVCF